MRNHAQATFSDTDAEIGEAIDFIVHVERQPGPGSFAKCWRFVAATGTPSVS
jgi:hypothetical protein